ncbi:MAG: DUF5723 family protein [Rikenellaceae bacterium]|nr:DUF5723 family protein [Rikenellaceae bacterium]
MKKLYKAILITAICTMGATGADAQFLRSAYFLDKSVERHNLNPALVPDRGFVTIPFVGSVNASYTSNQLALSDIFYQRDGKLVTFLDNRVSADEFLRGLKSNNQINADVRYDLVQAGWWRGEAFWSVGMSVKVNTSIGIPRSLLEFLKDGNGPDGRTYNISGLRAKTDAYAEFSVGYARDIDRRWSVGGRFKLLPGAGNADMRFDRLYATLEEDIWHIDSHGELHTSMKGLEYKQKDDDHGRPYVNGFDFGSFGIGGFGAAVDLGAQFKVNDNIRLSAALLDLGFIRWSRNATRYAKADGEFDYDGFELPVGDKDLPTVSDQFDAMKEDLENLFRFREEDHGRARTSMLVATLVMGAEYGIMESKITFGLLSTTRFYRPKAYTELTASVNFKPVWWFGGTLSYSAVHSNFQTYGLALNFTPNGFNFFVGSDYMITRVNSQYIPVNARGENLYLGMSVPLAYRRVPYRKPRKFY